jgi:hypothetical protein
MTRQKSQQENSSLPSPNSDILLAKVVFVLSAYVLSSAVPEDACVVQ